MAELVEAKTRFPGQGMWRAETDSLARQKELRPNGPVLWGLRFGNYELCDPVSIEVANSNSSDEIDEFGEAHESSAPEDDLGFNVRRAFVLNDELEAEAERRREFDVVVIPERRFGKPLSDECSLRFRYVTSWPDIDVEVFDSKDHEEKVGKSFRLIAIGLVFLSIVWFAHFGV